MTDSHPEKIYVELTTRCNLRCPMCVKHTAGCSIVESDMELAVFKRLTPALCHAKNLVLNGIGEPLLHPDLHEIIHLARSRMPGDGIIGLQSNGLLLDEDRAMGLVRAGLDTVCLSVDELRGPGEGKGRAGGHDFAAVARAVQALGRVRTSVATGLRIGLEMVVTRENVDQLPELTTWGGDNGIDYLIVTQLFSYGGSEKGLFNPNYREAVEIFNVYNRQAYARGVNLGNHLAAFMAFAKTPADKEMLRIVEEMHRAAKEKDVHLHINSLLQYDDPEVSRIEDIFQLTRTLAEAASIELFLPPLQANSHRSCPFVSDHATFVAGNGDVMPCYFLWHSYSCRVQNEEVQVRQRSFGNLHHQSLEEIWQGEEYRAFREEASRGQYASCWSCTLGPCSNLINDSQYANDCYGSSVPCGHCQWSLGGIRCL